MAIAPAATPTAIGSSTLFSDSGIASRYPGDKGIGNDPAVILADDFESYRTPDEAKIRWGNGNGFTRMRIATEAANVFAGGKSLEMALPISTTEVSCSLWKVLSPEQDTVYMRMYHKFDSNYYVKGSNHNGIRLSAHYPEQSGIKPPADGTGFFLFLLQNSFSAEPGEVPPGYTDLYVYWERQRSQWGDHWYPDGRVIPYDPTIGNQGEWLAYPAQYPDFKPYPQFIPQLGRWYCVELMVHANTPGKNDGEVKYWIDGKVAGDFPDLNMRSINTLKLDHAHMMLHAGNTTQAIKKWYDNVVIATQYIGPMASATPSPTPTVTPTPTVSPSPSASPTPTPTPVTNQTLENISTRGVVQTGNGVLIGGFILQGNTSKEVLMRGLGPSLSAFGVANVLSNPLIELHDSTGALIGRNDGWTSDFNYKAIPVTLQPSNDSESALDRTLSPGSYTVILKGAQGQTGVGLFELYDISGGSSVIGNISTRGVVQTGDDVIIGGFILGGKVGQTRRVIVRAIGPSLARFGVTGCLANPSLRIFNSDGALIAQNDNWRDSQAAKITQTLLAPLDPLESAIILNLSPGNYTAVVSGVGGNTGNALVEVYQLP